MIDMLREDEIVPQPSTPLTPPDDEPTLDCSDSPLYQKSKEKENNSTGETHARRRTSRGSTRTGGRNSPPSQPLDTLTVEEAVPNPKESDLPANQSENDEASQSANGWFSLEYTVSNGMSLSAVEAKIRQYIQRPFLASEADGLGYSYVLFSPNERGYFKIGSTKEKKPNSKERMEDHRKCKLPRSWDLKYTTTHPIRGFRHLERLAQKELKHTNIQFKCPGCNTGHIEFFEGDFHAAILVLERWGRWLRYSKPYDETGALKSEWLERLNNFEFDRFNCGKPECQRVSITSPACQNCLSARWTAWCEVSDSGVTERPTALAKTFAFFLAILESVSLMWHPHVLLIAVFLTFTVSLASLLCLERFDKFISISLVLFLIYQRISTHLVYEHERPSVGSPEKSPIDGRKRRSMKGVKDRSTPSPSPSSTPVS
jgi:hypothetical protein